jgi:hypothetical protein
MALFTAFHSNGLDFWVRLKLKERYVTKFFLVKNVKNKNENTQLFFFTSILGGL